MSVYIAFRFAHYYPVGGMDDARRIFEADDDDAALEHWKTFEASLGPGQGGFDVCHELVRLDLDREPPDWTSVRKINP